MSKEIGSLIAQGEVVHHHNSLLANGEQLEILLKDGRRLMGKILPKEVVEGSSLNVEREMLRQFCESGA